MIYSTVSDNIGQMTVEEAQGEIDRLHKQDGRNWRTDSTPQMYVIDECDEDVHNPCTLWPGNVWVICD